MTPAKAGSVGGALDWSGRELPVEVGPVAHGGHCVARHEGRVVFVRHTLPGERVIARVTEDRGGSYCRADAVEVLRAAPDRVAQPCPHARPGRCGGCDWQHATPQAQRDLKAAVVTEQLERLGGRPGLAVTVEPAPGGSLGWRSRVRFAVTADGTVGLHRHRSHDIEPVEHCPLATPAVDGVGIGMRRWPGAEAVEVVVSSSGDRALVVTPRPGARVAVPGLGAADDAAGGAAVLTQHARGGRTTRVRGHRAVREKALGRTFRVGAAGFWQVHPAAAEMLAAAVVEALAPRPGESVIDLYAGAGLFAAALAPHVPGGRVVAVESDREAAGDAAYNLRDVGVPAAVEIGPAAQVLKRLSGDVDLVVLDPPRAGAGAPVVAQIAVRRPRAVAYVACDPASFARDVSTFAGHGLHLVRVRAFDLFPMTHQVECVGLLQP
ncbi:MAG: TRAM domain-containing protein [Pseudonocardiales bacterium]